MSVMLHTTIVWLNLFALKTVVSAVFDVCITIAYTFFVCLSSSKNR